MTIDGRAPAPMSQTLADSAADATLADGPLTGTALAHGSPLGKFELQREAR
jgi:hypothetical protein